MRRSISGSSNAAFFIEYLGFLRGISLKFFLDLINLKALFVCIEREL